MNLCVPEYGHEAFPHPDNLHHTAHALDARDKDADVPAHGLCQLCRYSQVQMLVFKAAS